MAASPRNPIVAPWLDLRAYKINDPVERLRFLRREMQALESECTSRRGAQNWKWAIAAGLALVAILAAARPTHVSATMALVPTPAISTPTHSRPAAIIAP